MRHALRILTGVAGGYLASWALHRNAFIHALIGAGLMLWLVVAFAFAGLLALRFLLWFIGADK